MTASGSELETLLSEDRSAVMARERAAADLLGGASGRPVVLFGAGGLGRRTLAGLREIGIECLAFSDNASSRWGSTVDGLPLLSPTDAAAQFGASAVFIVTIWHTGGGHRFPHTQQQLRALGCASVISFVPLFWSFPDRFLPYLTIDLPHHILDAADSVRRTMGLWADDASRREYVAQLRWRLWADFDGLSLPVSHEQYFAPDLFAMTEEDVIADCGAFDGDTVRCVVERVRLPFRQIHAFEPDPASFAALKQYVASLAPSTRDRIVLHDLAVSSHWETASFEASGSFASSLSAAGTVQVVCAPLDDVLADSPPTFIKMDVEGAELAALRGTTRFIRTRRPILAVASYHRQSHLWAVPLLISSAADAYCYFLRPHQLEGYELVCYAVPSERLLPAATSSAAPSAIRRRPMAG